MSLSEIDFFKISGSSWWRHRLAVRWGEQRCVTTKEKVWKMEKMRLRLRLARRQQTPQTFWGRGQIFPMQINNGKLRFVFRKILGCIFSTVFCSIPHCTRWSKPIQSNLTIASRCYILLFLLSFPFETSSKLVAFVSHLSRERTYHAIQCLNQYWFKGEKGQFFVSFPCRPPSYLFLFRQVRNLLPLLSLLILKKHSPPIGSG